ncbi:MAG: hypothetical protein Phyf2KO_03120 [Phycisphaerales bacterium]
MESKEFMTEEWARFEPTSRASTGHEREAARLLRDTRSTRRGFRVVLGPLTLMVRWRSGAGRYRRARSVRLG